MKIDPATGFPYPPEGLRWEVTPTTNNDGFWVGLAVVDNRRLSDCRDDRNLVFSFSGIRPQHRVRPRHLRRVAREVLRKRAKRLSHVDLGADARSRFVGTYPPKKLGGA